MKHETKTGGKSENGKAKLRLRVKRAKAAAESKRAAAPQPGDPHFLKVALKLAKPRHDLPKDYALNHGHYCRGEQKK